MLRWTAPQCFVFILFSLSTAISQEQSRRISPSSVSQQGLHGGELYALNGCRCEVILTPKSLHVYLYDNNGKPLPAREIRGRISFQDGKHSRTYRYDLYPEGPMGNALYLPVNRSMSVKQSKSFDITIHGLPSRQRRTVTVALEFKTSILK